MAWPQRKSELSLSALVQGTSCLHHTQVAPHHPLPGLPHHPVTSQKLRRTAPRGVFCGGDFRFPPTGVPRPSSRGGGGGNPRWLTGVPLSWQAPVISGGLWDVIRMQRGRLPFSHWRGWRAPGQAVADGAAGPWLSGPLGYCLRHSWTPLSPLSCPAVALSLFSSLECVKQNPVFPLVFSPPLLHRTSYF